jgi:Fe-S-cluster containining protein
MTGRMQVGVDSIVDRLACRCLPEGCPAPRGAATCCCIGAAVEVSRGEAARLDAAMAGIAALQPRLRGRGGMVDVFTREGDGYTIEPVDERGTCPFLFRRRGRDLCAIHSWALAAGVEVASVKPRACRLWPLVVEARRGVPTVTVHPDALRIGCVAPRRELPGHPSVREAFAAEIADLQGSSRRPRRGTP